MNITLNNVNHGMYIIGCIVIMSSLSSKIYDGDELFGKEKILKHLHHLREHINIIDTVLMVKKEKEIEELETKMEIRKLTTSLDDMVMYTFDELLQLLKHEDEEYVLLKSQKSILYKTLDILENQYEEINAEITQLQQHADAIKPHRETINQPLAIENQ